MTLENSRRAGAEFLVTDLDLAMTFLEVARTSKFPETVQRNLRNARKAHDTVLRLMPRAGFIEIERRAIYEKLARLKESLEQFGERF